MSENKTLLVKARGGQLPAARRSRIINFPGYGKRETGVV